jgi:hypothetical protein
MRLEGCKRIFVLAMRNERPDGTLITQIGLMTASFFLSLSAHRSLNLRLSRSFGSELQFFCGKKQGLLLC